MSRKQQMIIAEGISRKNILPRFGTNNQPNLKLEQDMRKFMEPKPKLEEASGGSTLADANANNVTGDGAVGPAAAEAAGASGVNEPVLRAVGEQASNLAARATSGDGPDRYEMGEAIVNEFLSDLSEALMGTETNKDKGNQPRDYAASIIKDARTLDKVAFPIGYNKLQDELASHMMTASNDKLKNKDVFINAGLHYAKAMKHQLRRQIK